MVGRNKSEYSNLSLVEGFISSLTGAKSDDIRNYSAEIVHDFEFHHQTKKKRLDSADDRWGKLGIDVGAELGRILYTLCRLLKPDNIVETGIRAGACASYILKALQTNNKGVLYSIGKPESIERGCGWLIPDYLKHSWELIEGRSYDILEPLLEELGAVDLFLHDSENTYEIRTHEFQLAWRYLRQGGLLISHGIDYNDAFKDFCYSIQTDGRTVRSIGALFKPLVWKQLPLI